MDPDCFRDLRPALVLYLEILLNDRREDDVVVTGGVESAEGIRDSGEKGIRGEANRGVA